jgi:hypothetical protein
MTGSVSGASVRLATKHRPARPAGKAERRSTMELTNRETWTLIHGMIIGSLFLLAFAGG